MHPDGHNMNKLVVIAFSFSLLFLGLSSVAQDNGDNPSFNDNATFFQDPDLDLKNQIELYPNPSVKYLFVEIKNSSLKEVEFEMHSIIGTRIIVEYEEIGEFKYRIPVEELNAGYYFLLVKDNTERFNRAFKFVKR